MSSLFYWGRSSREEEGMSAERHQRRRPMRFLTGRYTDAPSGAIQVVHIDSDLKLRLDHILDRIPNRIPADLVFLPLFLPSPSSSRTDSNAHSKPPPLPDSAYARPSSFPNPPRVSSAHPSPHIASPSPYPSSDPCGLHPGYQRYGKGARWG